MQAFDLCTQDFPVDFKQAWILAVSRKEEKTNKKEEEKSETSVMYYLFI